ncbi:MAG TPA: GNAT family N-acetyltransferase [Candidatus Binatia bacterium]|nr:GNAT family N-acetyltransferase [Candidatus Binatia bacterium]
MTDPILRDFPDRFLSERLLIRAPLPGDGAEVHAAIEESLDELRPWMPWAHLEQTPDDVEANVRHAIAEFAARRDLRLHLYLRDGGGFVGSSGLHRIEWSVPCFEIGYWVRTSLTGRGFATEATRRIAEFAFDDLRAERVEIWCDAANERSAAVARGAGFTFEARLARNRRDAAGAITDSLCFARLR